MGLHWSLAAVLAGFVLGELSRIVLKRVLPKKFHPYAKELISTFQLSVCAFEIGVIGRFYSTWVSLSCSFVLLTLKNAEFIFEGALANPCAIWEDVLYKKQKNALRKGQRCENCLLSYWRSFEPSVYAGALAGEMEWFSREASGKRPSINSRSVAHVRIFHWNYWNLHHNNVRFHVTKPGFEEIQGRDSRESWHPK